MNRSILFFTIIIFSISAYSQIYAPNFSFTDTQGNSHELYTELNLGKPVVLSFFGVTCGTCITNVPLIENIWQTYGSNGQNLWAWGIESIMADDSDIDTFLSNYGGTYPCFSTQGIDSVLTLYNITYTPQTFLVCHDKTMKPLNLNSPDAMIEGCINATSNTIYSNEKIGIIAVSSGKNAQIQISVNNPKATEIQIFDLLGNKISILSDGFVKGFNSLNISEKIYKQGYYIVRFLENGHVIDTRKIAIIK